MATACWADLHGDLLVSIATAAGNGSPLKYYMCLRGVCKAWRSALVPPCPFLLSLVDERISVSSLSARCLSSTVAYSHSTVDDDEGRWTCTPRTARLVGYGKGRLAITLGRWISSGRYQTEKIILVGPSTGEEVKILPRVTVRKEWYPVVHKIVFAPGPNDGMIVVIYDQKRVSYIDTSSCRDDMKWTAVDFRPEYDEHLVDLVFDDAQGGKVYFLGSRGGVRVLRIPRGVGMEPLQAIVSLPGDVVSAPPYHMASVKNLFFCHGSLYQVWQNTSVAVSSRDGFTMSANEIFVMRRNGQWPYCWDEVQDLGGCSVFVGKNNSPVVARAGSLPDMETDSVYWIDWRGVPMVCDMATGTSKRCFRTSGVGVDSCWFF